MSPAICMYRHARQIDGPLFIRIDTHALSRPELEVPAANHVEGRIAHGAENKYTSTPVVSHAMLVYNRARTSGLADGTVVTPSHNPPEDSGFMYNPPHGGPADNSVTDRIQIKANALLEGQLPGLQRSPYAQTRRAATTREHDFVTSYLDDLASVLDLGAIRSAGVRIGVDPLGGAGAHYWPRIAKRYGLDLTVISDIVDKHFGFMTLDWNGRIPTEPSSPYAMQRLLAAKDRFDISFACDTDHDRHGIAHRATGLLPPNHCLAVAIDYLIGVRTVWPAHAAVGKSVVTTSLIDHVQRPALQICTAKPQTCQQRSARFTCELPTTVPNSVASIAFAVTEQPSLLQTAVSHGQDRTNPSASNKDRSEPSVEPDAKADPLVSTRHEVWRYQAPGTWQVPPTAASDAARSVSSPKPMRSIAILLVSALAACEGPPGPPGPLGGVAVPPGEAGATAPWLTQPGVALAITDLSFNGSAASVGFTLTDGNGVGLDPSGVFTAGPVELGFVVAQLATNTDGSAAQYTAYTTLVQTSPITGASATQATTESTGALHVVDSAMGTYRYDVVASMTGLESTATQTVAAFAMRGTAITRDELSARPDGGAIATREVVTSATCESCHQALNGHGGRWTKTSQCILCHQPQSSDPDTGNTVDFKVMVHKIHRGSSLPSVVAGTPYQIIGYMQGVHDFSTVVFPQDIGRCAACHVGAEADHWKTAPSKTTCTSCHDTTSFVLPAPTGTVAHRGGPQPDNAMCAVCHPSTGSIAGISDKHLVGLLAPDAPTVALTISAMNNTLPGQTPTMTFEVLVNGAPRDLIAAPLDGMVVAIMGPNTDSNGDWETTIQGDGAAGTLTAIDASAGTYSYTFPAEAGIPPDATGSYSVALEGYLQPVASGPRYAALNPVLAFAVTDATPQPRRVLVSRANCNNCHYDLAAHGGQRKNTEYCVFCHDPSEYDTDGAPRFKGTSNVLADTIDFRHMLHKIHAGTTLTQPYVMGGEPFPTPTNPGGTQHDFASDRYPAPLTACSMCHTSQNWTLPLPSTDFPSTSGLMSCSEGGAPNSYCDDPFWNVTNEMVTPPETSACTGCHDARDTLAHAQLNTTVDGLEACATCHGPGAIEDVAVVHGQM